MIKLNEHEQAKQLDQNLKMFCDAWEPIRISPRFTELIAKHTSDNGDTDAIALMLDVVREVPELVADILAVGLAVAAGLEGHQMDLRWMPR